MLLRICKLFSLLYMIFVLSCSSDRENLILEKQIISTSKPIENFGRTIGLTYDNNSGLLFLSNYGSSSLVGVYNQEFRYLGSFIQNGEGPNEQLSNFSIQINDKEDVVVSFDLQKNSIFFYKLDSIRKLSFENSLIKELRFKNHSLNRPVYIDSGRIVDISPNLVKKDENYLLAYLDSTSVLGNLVRLPSYSENFDPLIVGNAYFTSVNYDSINKLVFASFFFSDLIISSDLKGNNSMSYHGPIKFDPSYTFEDYGDFIRPIPIPNETKLGYTSKVLFFDNRYLVGFHGRLISEGEKFNKIIEFNEKLVPTKIYLLDVHIDLFTIDVFQKKIIAMNSENSELLYFFDFD